MISALRALDINPRSLAAFGLTNSLMSGWSHNPGSMPDSGLPHAAETVKLKPEVLTGHVAYAAMLGSIGLWEDARAALEEVSNYAPIWTKSLSAR